MIYCFEKKAVTDRLARLSDWKRLAFGALLLNRALPGFRAFETETGAPGAVVLQDALAKAIAALRQDGSPKPQVTAADCSDIAPDTEDHSSAWTSAALDAATVAAELMDFMDDRSVHRLANAADCLYVTAYMLAEFALDVDAGAPGSEERIQAHALVQQELAAQDGDLDFLEALTDDKSFAVSAIELRLRA